MITGSSVQVYVEVLDGSRIHNEAYEWARKMAVDALEYDEEEGNPANALEEILQEPEKLAELDLDAFAEELERQGRSVGYLRGLWVKVIGSNQVTDAWQPQSLFPFHFIICPLHLKRP